jgi:hypothetical protein
VADPSRPSRPGKVIEALNPIGQEPPAPQPDLMLVDVDTHPDLTQRDTLGAQQHDPGSTRGSYR